MTIEKFELIKKILKNLNVDLTEDRALKVTLNLKNLNI